jgi:hypothetical protein
LQHPLLVNSFARIRPTLQERSKGFDATSIIHLHFGSSSFLDVELKPVRPLPNHQAHHRDATETLISARPSIPFFNVIFDRMSGHLEVFQTAQMLERLNI